MSALVNNIPVVVTDVPSIESPSKFEDLLHDPKIVFTGQAGLKKLNINLTFDTIKTKENNNSPYNCNNVLEQKLQCFYNMLTVHLVSFVSKRDLNNKA